MSIEIDWENLTTGPDGLILAESIREFIHDKFQQVALPRFIQSVQVHSFEFGKECPSVELKDICDPLPDFYEDDDNEEEEIDEDVQPDGDRGLGGVDEARPSLGQQYDRARSPHQNASDIRMLPPSKPPSFIDTRLPGLRSNYSLADQIASPLLSRSSTPGIPGGTSNLSYFHLPLSAGLSGSQTPLAAVAGGTPYSAGWHDHHAPPWESHQRRSSPQRSAYLYQNQDHGHADPSTRPSTADSYSHPHEGPFRQPTLDGIDQPPSETHGLEPDPSDLQIVLHVSYSGSVRLSLTAEILLDYPMPSFVGIPLKLNITGLTFDGVALIAYLHNRRAHFCFLGQEDAETLVNVDTPAYNGDGRSAGGTKADGCADKVGGLLREIRVESEIGQKEGGRQVLKNVGKVEKFVLEQVRRIFEDEFVYPSFWTFLV
ncbi:Mitochondrial distribution and morphology protein 12 [Varicellaria rhodocarpa]|nr:Mitochondrial distribution and morphology protein 12 [Varicellaria rhodocarpa]